MTSRWWPPADDREQMTAGRHLEQMTAPREKSYVLVTDSARWLRPLDCLCGGRSPRVAAAGTSLLYPAPMPDPRDLPNPGITVRPAAPEDCPLIAALIFELATYERQPEDCHATPEALLSLLFERRPPAAECLLAERGEEPLGFALFFSTFSTWECAPGIWLEDLFVRPEHRGRGAGKALFQAVADLAVSRGSARLEWSVLDWNQPALDFYRARGAKAMDGWTTHRLDGEGLRRNAR